MHSLKVVRQNYVWKDGKRCILKWKKVPGQYV